MNVKQALKAKNTLVSELKAKYQILQRFNSIEEGNPRRYSMTQTMNEINQLTKELVELKAQIHRANQPVYDKIFALAEAKGLIKELKKVPTDEGKQTERYGSVQSIKEVELTIVDIERLVAAIQKDIELLQDELDVHNATTQI